MCLVDYIDTYTHTHTHIDTQIHKHTHIGTHKYTNKQKTHTHMHTPHTHYKKYCSSPLSSFSIDFQLLRPSVKYFQVLNTHTTQLNLESIFLIHSQT